MDSAKNSLLLLYDIASKAIIDSYEGEHDSVQHPQALEDNPLHEDNVHSNIESPTSTASRGTARDKKIKRKLDITSEGILINSSSGLCIKNSTSNKVLSCNQLRQSCPEIFVLCNRLKSYRKMMLKKQANGSASEALNAVGSSDSTASPASNASTLPSNWIENTLRCLSAVFCCHSCNGSAIIREVIDSGCIVKLFPFQELVKENGNFPFVGNYRGISQTCSGVNVIKNSITNLYTKEITKADFLSITSFSINLERDTLLFMRQLNAITSRFVWRSNGFTQLGYDRELEVYGMLRCCFSSAGLIKYFAIYFDPSCVIRHSVLRDKDFRRVKVSAFEPI